ncbi:hypothetical protein BKA64DRAFT_750712 [Cadophora sp. MPI-SDFR-AT-0126]|nr:hypothetical protein BKA64DRAFT_750712 [Leotiomycetes sp. MPI-SDFR-AT-0126]
MELTKVDFALSRKRLSWKDLMAQGAMDALITLLLSQLHHVTNLVLGPMFTFETALLRQLFYAALFKQADHELPTYQHLRVLCLNFDARLGRTIHALRSIDLLPWFHLPAVREFSLISSMPTTWDEIPMQTPASSLLTMLHLTAVEPKHLGHLLTMTPKLKKLRYDWYYRSGVHLGRPDEGSVWVNLDGIGRALVCVRESLEELVITSKCSIEVDNEYDFLDFERTLSRIVELDCLKALQIPLPFLSGNFDARGAIAEEDVIPRNLESLTITDDVLLEWPWQPEWYDTSVSSALERWLRNLKRLKTEPVLKTLVLKEVVRDWSPVMKEELSQICQHYDLDFRVIGFRKKGIERVNRPVEFSRGVHSIIPFP